MRSIARYRGILSLLCLAVLAMPAPAADLHFILLCDTLDASIGTPTDLVNAQAWAQAIAANTGLTLRMHTVAGSDLTVPNARTAVDAVQPGPEDAVFFLYSGHGGNPGNSQWPRFYFTASPAWLPDAERLSFDEVVQVLRPRNPRLLVVLADACNNYPNQSGHWGPTAPIPTSPEITQAFRDLFTGFTGEVLTSGCKPGQYSLGAAGEGALFFNSLTNAIYTLAGTQSPLTWATVLARAAADTTAAAALSGQTQEPQYLIHTGPVVDSQSSSGTSPSATPLSAPVPLCGAAGILPLTICAIALPLFRFGRRRTTA